eukprot:gene16923-20109_t
MAGGTRDAANNTKFLWWLVRVLKNEDGDLYPPGHAGAPKEKCVCLACSKKLAAQTQRIASHYAQKRGCGVEICVGATSQRLDESETDFQESRKRQFIAAKERCAEFLKEQERLKEKKREVEGLNRVTAGGEISNKRRQTTLPHARSRELQEAADVSLARVLYLNNIPPFVLDSKSMQVTYFYGPAPVEGASEEEVTAYKAHRASQLAKRCAAEIQLLQFKMKRGVFARDTVWEVVKTVSAADFWFLYGGAVKELQLPAMRACAQ